MFRAGQRAASKRKAGMRSVSFSRFCSVWPVRMNDLLGFDFLRSHRVFISNTDEKLYFTTRAAPWLRPRKLRANHDAEIRRRHLRAAAWRYRHRLCGLQAGRSRQAADRTARQPRFHRGQAARPAIPAADRHRLQPDDVRPQCREEGRTVDRRQRLSRRRGRRRNTRAASNVRRLGDWRDEGAEPPAVAERQRCFPRFCRPARL